MNIQNISDAYAILKSKVGSKGFEIIFMISHNPVLESPAIDYVVSVAGKTVRGGSLTSAVNRALESLNE